MKHWFLVFSTCLIFGCVSAPGPGERPPIRWKSVSSDMRDDLDLYGLRNAMQDSIKALLKRPDELMDFTDRSISQEAYANALKELVLAIDFDPSGQGFYNLLDEKFEVYEAYAEDGWAAAYITSYYSPVLPASQRKTKKLSTPLYELPKDSVFVNLNAYADAVPSLKKAVETKPDLFPRSRLWRGRVVKNEDRSEVIPYYNRSEILERAKKRQMQAKVIAYVDPIDAFFLQIQGSGTLKFHSGRKITLAYAGQNGWPYYAIGRALKEHIPIEEMSQQKIEAHLRSVDSEERNRIMNLNNSYIFFDSKAKEPMTLLGTRPTAGRTIATDTAIYPKGALAFLEYPILEELPNGSLMVSKNTSSRFVMDQDTGGAIKGPGRVDLYWGRDVWAKVIAGHMKGPGSLRYLVPKQED